MKKYLLLIPTLFVMLLNVIGCGQVVYAADSDVDYSQYWRTLESYDEKYFYNDEALISEFQPILSNRVGNVDYPYYFVCFYVDKYSYSSFVENGGTLSIRVWFVFLKSSDFSSNSYGILLGADYDDTFTLTASFRIDDSYQITSDLFSISYYYTEYGNLLYYTNTSYFIQSQYQMHPLPESDYFNDSNFYLYQNSNIPDFPFPDFVNHGGSSDELKVEVDIYPALNGEFDRRVEERGRIITLENFNLTVINNSSFPIQYAFFIVKPDEVFTYYYDGVQSWTTFEGFTGHPSYVYLSDEWCSIPKVRLGNTYSESVRKPCAWHYLSSGDSDSIDISFSQMKLIENQGYNVLVYAIRNDSDNVLLSPSDSVPPHYSSTIELETATEVYYSNFICKNPAEFNPDNNSSDSYAYDPDDDSVFRRATARKDENGDTVIELFDTRSNLNPNVTGSSDDAWGFSNKNTVSLDINQLSLNFSSFFRFVNTVFGYFPKNYQSVIVLGLTSLVVVAILKVVF